MIGTDANVEIGGDSIVAVSLDVERRTITAWVVGEDEERDARMYVVAAMMGLELVIVPAGGDVVGEA